MKNFLKSCINILKQNGKVVISLVDTPYYKGVFDYENLGFKEYGKSKIYKFNPLNYKGYIRTKTHKEENGLANYDDFISLAFTLK